MNFVLHIYNYKNLVSRIQSHDTLVFSAFPLVSQGLPVDQVGVAVQLGSSALSLSLTSLLSLPWFLLACQMEVVFLPHQKRSMSLSELSKKKKR